MKILNHLMKRLMFQKHRGTKNKRNRNALLFDISSKRTTTWKKNKTSFNFLTHILQFNFFITYGKVETEISIMVSIAFATEGFNPALVLKLSCGPWWGKLKVHYTFSHLKHITPIAVHGPSWIRGKKNISWEFQPLSIHTSFTFLL